MEVPRYSVFSLLHRPAHRGSVLHDTYRRVASFLHTPELQQSENSGETQIRKCVLLMTGALLLRVPEKKEKRQELFRQLLTSEYNFEELDHLVIEMEKMPSVSPEETGELLAGTAEHEKSRVLEFLLALSLALGGEKEDLELVRKFSAAAGFPAELLENMLQRMTAEAEQRKKILRSGTGILVALVVLAVFLITATLLRSVIFGLIIAYLLLPLEKHFEKQHRNRSGFSYFLFRILMAWKQPLLKLSGLLMRRNPDKKTVRRREKREQNIIKAAVAQTAFCSALAAVILLTLFFGCTGRYVSSIKNNVDRWREAAEQQRRNNTLVLQAQMQLERLREKFEKLPVIQAGLDRVEHLLNDEKARNEFLAALLRRSGGVFSFTAGVVGTIIAIGCDLLLTVFFALLFLSKLAEFCQDDNSSGRRSEYLVRTVFNGKWLPGASDIVIDEANRIIGGMMRRLQIWVKGYLTLVLVDSTVYCTLFFFLGVPYFPLLGILAGCGILLPYIGPVISCSVTVLVTLAAGHGSGLLLLEIVGCYLLYNGIIEQFILYPAVIGESLGLTTLETIIVVLLGAIFAGIPGMLFALPAASVLKYLVPQIYRCWETRRNANS